MMENVIFAAENYIREVFSSDSSGHDVAHTLRVCRMAEIIARQEGADVSIVKLAALLHCPVLAGSLWKGEYTVCSY